MNTIVGTPDSCSSDEMTCKMLKLQIVVVFSVTNDIVAPVKYQSLLLNMFENIQVVLRI